jgi:hypothetical protein
MMDTNREREWQILHDRITELLDRYGRKNAFGEGDYWLLDDHLGPRRQELEIQNLNLFRPHIVKLLQALLADFPDWHITAQVDVRGKEGIWPGMGIVIYPNEVVDELQRDFLPEEFRNIEYNSK